MKKLLALLSLAFSSLLSAADDGAQHVNATEAAKLVEAGKVLVLDVRTEEEFNDGHIQGATLIDFLAPTFETKIKALDPAATYLVHCQVGGRSTRALKKLQAAGIKNLIHLDGGFGDWQAAGLPTEK